MTKMSEQMKKNIENYADEIITLEDFVAAVRQNIGMYIGRKGDYGFKNMIREIFQNSSDEVNKDDSPATKIIVSFIESTFQTTISDNGRGIPFGNMYRVFAEQHTGSNYVKKKGEYSSGMHGVGSKVTNALSKFFAVDSYIFGQHRRIEFVDGHVSKPEYDDGSEVPPNAQGTTVTFIPSQEVLGPLTVKSEDIIALIELLLPITKVGTLIDFYGTKLDGSVVERHYQNTQGMEAVFNMNTSNPLVQPVYIYKDTGEMKIEGYFTYDSANLEGSIITGFANYCPTSGGTHMKGFVDGVCKYFRNYMNKIFLGKKSNLTIINQDVLSGLRAILHTCHLHPIFTGQAKEELGNEDMYKFVMDAVMEALEVWGNTNSKDLQKICKFFKGVAETRVKNENGKIKLINKINADVLTGLPKKYTPANGKKSDGLELWISEGDSANGSMLNSRNNKTQALYPVRGKTKNPFVSKISDLLKNEEIAGIVAICGGTYGKNFDISKCPFEKVILATDRDPDGSHILTNLSATFLILMPELVQRGMLFKALPPLYSVPAGKNKKIYFGTRMEYVEHLQRIFSKNNTLIVDGKQLNPKEVNSMLYNNIDYMYDLEKVSKNYAVDPRFLETIIKHIDIGFDNLQELLKRMYDNTIEISRINGNIILQGLVFNRFQTLLINDRFYQEAKYIQNKYLYDANAEYVLNGEKILWLYDIMDRFDKSTNLAVTRYKGLGEMNPRELFITTMDPENRNLIRYTSDDIKRDIAKLREYDSDEGKKRLIKNCVATRSDLLG